MSFSLNGDFLLESDYLFLAKKIQYNSLYSYEAYLLCYNVFVLFCMSI